MKTQAWNFINSDPSLLLEIRHGIERETLRVDDKARASAKAHPYNLGHKLTHKYITTDYSENLLEFITDVHRSGNELLSQLNEIHAYTYLCLENEYLWPISMPAILPSDEKDIPLAYFGDSDVGKLKTLYRSGLGHRYGRSMQSIAGVHYNFSLTDRFWEAFKIEYRDESSLKEFKNKKYFDLIRNFQRYKWMIMYFFGASNVVHESFLNGKKHNLSKVNEDTYCDPNAISLRMGGLGYTSSAQESINICFNQVETYIDTLERARLKSYPPYEKIGLKEGDQYKQLNTNLLQIDNEFYSTVRPKNLARSKESALMALHQRGIEYIEIRLCDVNPFSPVGISSEQIGFLQIFLMWCLVSESSPLSDQECEQNKFNFDQIVKYGLDSKLMLKRKGRDIYAQEWLKEVLSQMEKVSKIFSQVDPHMSVCFDDYFRKVENPQSLLSARYLDSLRAKSFDAFHLELAKQHKSHFKFPTEKKALYETLRDESYHAEKAILTQSNDDFSTFLNEYFEQIKISEVVNG